MIIELSITDMRKILGATVQSIHTDPMRPGLNCLLLEANGVGLTAVATDRHWLARFSLMLETPVAEPVSVMLPRGTALEVQKALRKARYGVPVRIDTEACDVTIPMVATFPYAKVDRSFPPYQHVLPDYRKQTNRAGIRWMSIDGSYLGKASEAFSAARDSSRESTVALMLEFGASELDPVLISSPEVPGLHIVVMPFRAYAKDKAPYPAVTEPLPKRRRQCRSAEIPALNGIKD